MARIKIDDLNIEQNLNCTELNRIKGGTLPVPIPSPRYRGFFAALPDPMPGPGLVSVTPITIPRPIRGISRGGFGPGNYAGSPLEIP